MTPDDKVIHKEWEKDMKEAKEYVRKLSIISTKDKDKEEPVEEKENVQEKVMNQIAILERVLFFQCICLLLLRLSGFTV